MREEYFATNRRILLCSVRRNGDVQRAFAQELCLRERDDLGARGRFTTSKPKSARRCFSANGEEFILTPAGDALLSGVRPLFDRLAVLVHRTRLSHDGLLGQLRLGLARAALESERVSAAIAQMRGSYPQVELSVERRLRDPQPLRGPRNRSFLGYCDEIPQMPKDHAAVSYTSIA